MKNEKLIEETAEIPQQTMVESSRKREEQLIQHFKTIFHMIPEPTLITTLEDFRILDYNQAFLDNSGYTEQDIASGNQESRYLYTNDPEMREKIQKGLIQDGFVENLQVRFCSKTGLIRTALVSARLYEFDDTQKVVNVVRDITLLKQFESSLKERERQLELIFDNTPAGVIQYDREGRIMRINHHFSLLLRAPREKLLEVNMLQLPNEKLVDAIKMSLKGEKAIFEDYYQSIVSGHRVYVRATYAPLITEAGEVAGGIGIVEDYTEKKEMEEAIRLLSVTDKLTQLPNRLKLDEVLEKEVERAARTGISFAVVLLDIDQFKQINDKFGHQVGDRTLEDLSKILRSGIRVTDTIGRWGGEEFLLIAPHTDLSGGLLVAEKLREEIASVSFQTVDRMTCSFGVSVWQPGDTSSGIISRADEALYLAKRNGRNRVEKRT